jgi:type IV pilus assembly protein PilA
VGARRSESGFSLIELMTVVLVIAVLLAIAVPTLMGAQTRASDRAAQASMHHALIAENIVFTDNEQFSVSNATLRTAEPRLTYVTTVPAKDSSEVYVGTDATYDVIVLGAQSRSGKCFWARQQSPVGQGQFRWNTSTDCSAPPAVDDPGFTLSDAPG